MAQPKLHATSAVTERRGVQAVAQIVTRMGHAWNETKVDQGIDGVIELCDPGTRQALNRVILVQSKATRGRLPAETPETFEWPCNARDLDYWLGGNAPVILAVSKIGAATEETFWVDLKSYFADPVVRGAGRVAFDKRRDRFDESSADALMRLGAPASDGLFLPPAPISETVHSNLLRVTHVAPTVYVAETAYREERLLWDDFKARGQSPTGEWALWDRRIYSLLDLTRPPFDSICDRGTIDPIEIEYLSKSPDRDLTNVFVRLARKALREKLTRIGVRFDRAERHYHFTATRDLTKRVVDYRGREKSTSRAVFEAYPDRRDRGRIAYFRHSAFQDRFLRMDGDWYLEITPTYRFTSDGYGVHPMAPELLKKMKEMEHNDAVLGQITMWASVLTKDGDLLAEAYPYIGFGALATFEIDSGIDESLWQPADPDAVGREDDGPDGVLDLFDGISDAG